MLARIGQWLHLGHRCEEIKQLLPLPPSRGAEHAEPPADTDSDDGEARLCELEDALASARRSASSLEEQAVGYERQLAAEQAAHAETQRRLRNVQRELAEADRTNRRLLEANVGLHAQVELLERQANAPVWKRVFQ